MKQSDIMTFLRKTTIARRLFILFFIQTSAIFLWCLYIIKGSLNDYENIIRLHNSKLVTALSHQAEQSVNELKMATKLPILHSARGTSQIFSILSHKNKDTLNYGERNEISKDIFDISEAYPQASFVGVSDLTGFVVYGTKEDFNFHVTQLDIQSSLYQNILEQRGGFFMVPSDSIPLSKVPSPKFSLWGARAIMHINPLKPVGTILVCIDLTKALEEFQIGRFYKEQTAGIFARDGSLLLGDISPNVYHAFLKEGKKEEAGNLSITRMMVDDTRDLYHYVRTEDGSLVIIRTPYHLIINDVSQKQLGLYLLLLALIVSSIVITRLLVKSINYPVQSLALACNSISNEDFTIQIKDEAKDEIHDLILSFNTMSEKITFLIQEVYQKDILQAQTELQMLRSQINPHIIYNTLETIRASALASDNHNLAQMVSLFGKTLRYGVSSPTEPVLLKQEIDNLYDYITLQNMHFQGRINFNVNIEDSLNDCIVIKLLLQPLVENAMFHGFGAWSNPNSIDIFGFTDGNTLTFKVADNGIGIEEDTLTLLNGYINNQNNNFTSIGLKNVNRRIKLYYGESYGIHLESVFGRGTVITVTIPYQKEEIHD